MSRFVKLPMFYFEEDLMYFSEMWINPFQIESFVSLDLSYTNEFGVEVDVNGSRITTKSGLDYDINLTVRDLEKLLS
jgi:hypothetical protein